MPEGTTPLEILPNSVSLGGEQPGDEKRVEATLEPSPKSTGTSKEARSTKTDKTKKGAGKKSKKPKK